MIIKRRIRILKTNLLSFTAIVILSTVWHPLYSGGKHPSAKTKYNLLFIFIDDLRPELGYENKYIKSPNIDRLAATATVFTKQYVSVPTCGASRASILTGVRPKSTWDLGNDIFAYKQAESEKLNRPESFIQHLRDNGYYTVGIGKISHSPDGYIYKYTQPRSNKMELPKSWDEMLFNTGKWGTGWNAFFGYADGSNRNTLKGQVKPYEQGEVDDTGYPDGLTAELAVQKLQELSGKNKPFF